MDEVLLDIEEGADLVMVKPGIAYLDILRDLHDTTNVLWRCIRSVGNMQCYELLPKRVVGLRNGNDGTTSCF